MKNLTYFLLASMLVFSIISGCKKLDNTNPKTIALISGKTTLKINQPDSLILKDVPDAASIQWTVTPAGFNTVSTKDNIAVFTFSKAGSYTVKGALAGSNPLSASILVTDSLYTPPPPTFTNLPLTGDQITLTPYLNEDKTADTAYIYFTATTTKSYCTASRLDASAYVDNSNNYTMGFLEVSQPDDCTTGTGPVSTTIYYTQNPARALSNGTYPLTITLNGNTYNGSIEVTSTAINFNWSYTSGVIFSQTQISR